MNDKHKDHLSKRALERQKLITEFLSKQAEYRKSSKELRQATGRANAAQTALDAIGQKLAARLGEGYGYVHPDMYRFEDMSILSDKES